MTNDVATIDVVVRDGSTVCLRRTAESDVPALQEFLESLSVDSRYHRFMGLPVLTESASPLAGNVRREPGNGPRGRGSRPYRRLRRFLS